MTIILKIAFLGFLIIEWSNAQNYTKQNSNWVSDEMSNSTSVNPYPANVYGHKDSQDLQSLVGKDSYSNVTQTRDWKSLPPDKLLNNFTEKSNTRPNLGRIPGSSRGHPYRNRSSVNRNKLRGRRRKFYSSGRPRQHASVSETGIRGSNELKNNHRTVYVINGPYNDHRVMNSRRRTKPKGPIRPYSYRRHRNPRFYRVHPRRSYRNNHRIIEENMATPRIVQTTRMRGRNRKVHFRNNKKHHRQQKQRQDLKLQQGTKVDSPDSRAQSLGTTLNEGEDAVQLQRQQGKYIHRLFDDNSNKTNEVTVSSVDPNSVDLLNQTKTERNLTDDDTENWPKRLAKLR